MLFKSYAQLDDLDSLWTKYFLSTPHPYTIVPDGLYKPKDLNLVMPEVAYISVGKCYLQRKGLGYQWRTTEIAHATRSIGKPPSICFKEGSYLFSGPNTLHEVFLHEYAHILAPLITEHGEEWESCCRKLGIETPRAQIDYIHTQQPIYEFSYLKKKGLIGGIQYQGGKQVSQVIKKEALYDRIKSWIKDSNLTPTRKEKA